MRVFLLLTSLVLLGLPRPAAAEEFIGTLTLDGLSFLSFEHVENLGIPAGSTIRFRFAASSATGSVGFTIQPSDVSIPNIPLPGGAGELAYSLAQATTGTMTKTAEGFEVAFPAAVRAVKLPENATGGGTPHLLGFTTQHAQSTSLETAQTIHVDGMPVVPGPRYVQLAGAVTNPANAEPHPGRAVVTVLSGTFDWLPTLQ